MFVVRFHSSFMGKKNRVDINEIILVRRDMMHAYWVENVCHY